jgi:hypothetical protein
MNRADTRAELADAAKEPQFIAEVMAQTDGVVPARWMVWLGDCVSCATSRLTAGLAEIEIPPKRDPLPWPVRSADVG